MLSKFISRINLQNRSNLAKSIFNIYNNQIRCFADTTVQPTKRSYGGLKDSDRIFTNVYRDGDPYIEGALKRVNLIYTIKIKNITFHY